MGCGWLIFLASILWVGAAFPAAAQQVRNVAMPAPTRVEVKVDLRATEANKARYRQRLDRLSTHHLRVPLRPSGEPFSMELRIKPKTKTTRLPPEAAIKPGLTMERATVTGSSGMRDSETSSISEPTVAIRGDEVFVTGNTYAGLSLDAGKSFTYVDPAQMFGRIPGHEFCCDQVAAHDRATDTTWWLMQGYPGKEGNIYRLLLAKGDGLRKQEWYALTISSVEMLGRKGLWFDFPDVAFSDRFVYITANVYDMKRKFIGAAVMRFNKGALRAGEPHEANVVEDDVGCLRLVQGASTVMYWAGHYNEVAVKAGSWKDGDLKPASPVMIDVEEWVSPDPANTSGVLAKNKRPWLRRLDERVTASWIADGVIGIAWSAAQDERFKLPHIRIAKVKVDDLLKASGSPPGVVPFAQPHIWSNAVAFAYPSVETNDKGEAGIAMAYGTSDSYPSFAVGILAAKDSDPPEISSALEGKNSPSCPKPDPNEWCGVWGDYFTVRRDPATPSGWAVVGYTLQHRDTQRVDAEAELVRFRRGP